MTREVFLFYLELCALHAGAMGTFMVSKVDSQEGNGKQLGRKLQVVAGSFRGPCLSSREGGHRNCFRKDVSGPGSPKDGPATRGRAVLVERGASLRDRVI